MSVCLVMIVRDEEAWLGDCLESALELGIDRWVIADTGSADGTRELVRELLVDVPGELLELEWEGFGPARSEVLLRARGKADLILMLDADMVVRGELPEPPYEDAYLVNVMTGSWDVPLPLLVRGDRAWRYEGVAHSYLAADDRGGAWDAVRCGLWVDDRRPGGWRPGKLEEDARLLELELERNPRATRASFYLAQTYSDLARPADAIREYGRRIELGGREEERFVAMLRRGRLLADRSFNEGIAALLEAWEARPTRVEPLYAATRLCRIHGRKELALVLARRASTITKPAGDTLFLELDLYEWAVRLELGIAELHTGDRERGRQILAELYAEEIPPAYLIWISELLEDDQKEVAA